jgi:very-short-patch-repair endonuclease
MVDTRGTSGNPDRRLRAIASQQCSVFTRAQARNVGLTDRQVTHRHASGEWERLLPGVFRVAGAAPSPLEAAWAAMLWAGRQSVLSHLTAANLWQLDDVRGVAVEITIERPRSLRHQGIRVHRVPDLGAVERTILDGLRVTTIERTLVDVSAVLRPDQLEIALESALRRGLTSVDRMRDRVGVSSDSRRKGTRVIRSLLDHGTGGRPSGSAPEVRLAQLLVRGGLPSPVRQHEVRVGTQRFLLDLAYPAHRIGIEYDGARWHSGRVAQERDRTREHALVAGGWRVLRVTRTELQAGAPTVIAALRAVFADTGALVNL